MIKQTILFLFIAVSLVACKSQQEQHNSVEEKEKTTVITSKKGLLQTIQADNQDINVYTTEGLQPYLNKKSDKIQVVNFWATWCGPCVKELPYFEQVNQDMADEVEVTLVSLDFEDKLETALVNFVNKKDLQSDVIAVLPESEQELMESVSDNWAAGIPATLIYNKHKSYFIEGSLTHEELVAEIEKFKS